MKKVIVWLLALTPVLSLTACGKTNDAPAEEAGEQEEVDGGMGMVNPWVEVTSLDEVNEKTGGSLRSPGVMGVEDTYFAVMNDGEMGEYRFTLSGYDYTFRFAANKAEDISGVWVADGTVFGHDYPGELEFGTTDTAKLARWMDGDDQYVLMVEDNGEMEEDTFQSIAGEMQTITTME